MTKNISPRNYKWKLLLTFLFVFVAGCFVPIIAPQNKLKCELTTKKLTMDVTVEGVEVAADVLLHAMKECDEPECLAIFPLGLVAVPVASFTVSGSIVVVGNTIHWLEQQGRCENSATQKALKKMMKASKALGGKVIHSGKELATWLKQI